MLTQYPETHFEHPKYSTTHALHEAGYDSYLTAKVLIRLSAQLHAAGAYLNDREHVLTSDEENYHTAPEDGGVSLNPSVVPNRKNEGKKVRVPKGITSNRVAPSLQGVSLDAANDIHTSSTQVSSLQARKPKKAAKRMMKRTAFSHATVFDMLGDMSSEEQQENPPLEATVTSQPDSSYRAPKETSQQLPQPKISTMMPQFESGFWRVYGNKLRVFGTVENVCDLNNF